LVSGGDDSGAVEKKSGRNEGRKNMRIHRKKGFTLIELIVVIAILAILAAILVPTISGFIGRANDATDIANAKMLYNSGMMVLAEGGTGVFTTAAAPINAYVTSWPGIKNAANGASFRVTVTSTTVTVETLNASNAVVKHFDQASGKFVNS
jgi:type IV pilus assembly protein PilA